MTFEETYHELQLMSKQFQLDLAKGDLNWEDETIQFFLPVILYHTDFEWLKLIAENTLVEEDEEIVKNFLNMVESLVKVNTAQLNQAVEEKLKRLFGAD